MDATIFYALQVKDWKALEKISVEDRLVRLSGRRTFENVETANMRQLAKVSQAVYSYPVVFETEIYKVYQLK